MWGEFNNFFACYFARSFGTDNQKQLIKKKTGKRNINETEEFAKKLKNFYQALFYSPIAHFFFSFIDFYNSRLVLRKLYTYTRITKICNMKYDPKALKV